MNTVILDEVSNFDQYPDGRLRAGPFKSGPGAIARLLSRHRLRLGGSGERGICSKTIHGVMISCAGAGVRGYFLDDTGIEAPSSDLEAFLAEAVAPGTCFSVEGHHCPDETRMIRSNLSAWYSDGELMVSSQRVLLHRDGAREALAHQAPVPVFRAGQGVARTLCLVG